MSARYGVRVVNPTGALEGARFVATCRWPDCGWTSAAHVVKAGAEEQARWHRSTHRQHRDAGHATTAGLLLLLIFGGLLFLAALHLGQQALCDLHDQGLRYCAGYATTTPEESTR